MVAGDSTPGAVPVAPLRAPVCRGCLGRVVRGEPPPRACDNALRGCFAGAGGAGDGSAAPGGAAPPALEAVHLSPEEAFFMVHDLGCLEVVRGSTGDGMCHNVPERTARARHRREGASRC